jgi:hypothetical protein
MLVRKIFFDNDNIFRKNFYDLVKILGNVGQNMTTRPPPPPPMLMASRRPCPFRLDDWVYILRSWKPLQKIISTQMSTFSHVFAILICTQPTHIKMTRKDKKSNLFNDSKFTCCVLILVCFYVLIYCSNT